MRAKLLWSCPTICKLWTVAYQVLLSMGFSRQEYWSELPCSPLGDLPNPGIETASLMSLALAGGVFITRDTWELKKKPEQRLSLYLSRPGL